MLLPWTWLLVTGCVADPPRVDLCRELKTLPPSPAAAPSSGLIYEAYVRSFQDSDGDGIGDLQGMISRLPYLQRLGVEHLWLMPVFPSPGPAGYDAVALDEVSSDYGSEEDLVELIQAAGEVGITIMLDVPINHSSVDHPWFQLALAHRDSAEGGAYVFSHEQWDELRWFPTYEEDRWYYAYFGEEFPDFDWSSPFIIEEIPRALRHWTDLGVGGFRLDAVRQIVEDDGDISDTRLGHCTLAWLYAELASEGAMVFSEAWSLELETVTPYLGTVKRPQTDLVLGMPRHHAIVEALTQRSARVLIEHLAAEARAGVLDRMATHAGSHDLTRLLGRIPEPEVRRSWMVLLFTLPGSPVLYYGDEIDLSDTHQQPQDLPWRAPMAWDGEAWGGFSTGHPWMEPSHGYIDGVHAQAQEADPSSMLSLILGLVDLRAMTSALRGGELVLHGHTEHAVMAFERRPLDGDDARVLVVLNTGAEERHALRFEGTGAEAWFDLTAEGAERFPGTEGLTVPGRGYMILSDRDLSPLTVAGPLGD